jgi:hypothetical protein
MSNRSKGAKWERDLAKMLFLNLGIKFERNLEQYRTAAGGDLIPDNEHFPFSIEAKHYSSKSGRGMKPEWWKQSEKAAIAANKIPCVIYKYDRYPPKAVVSLEAIAKMYGKEDDGEILVELSIDGFCYLCREIMND